jgi:diguanylate cyclase (GGDEF)-like protein
MNVFSLLILKILQWIDKQSKLSITVSTLTLIVLIGFLDYITGHELGFSIFYLFPILIAAWCVGKRTGILLSFIAAVVWLIADMQITTPYSHSLIPYWNAFIRLSFFAISSFMLSTLRTVLENEKKLAATDYLTNIPNSRSFYQAAEYEIQRQRRYKHPFTVVYLDIDNFKTINDQFGHTTGDTLLRTVATVIKNNIRAVDIAARIAGDEFIILLPETTGQSAHLVIEKIRKNLLDVMQKNKWSVTFSFGVVTYTDPPHSVDKMIQRADELMYAAKRAGKSSIKYA